MNLFCNPLSTLLFRGNHLEYAEEHGQLTQEDIVKDLVQTFPELKPEDIQKKAAQVCSSEKEGKKRLWFVVVRKFMLF